LHDRENGYREEEEENGEQEEALEDESSQLIAPSLGESPLDTQASTTTYLRTCFSATRSSAGSFRTVEKLQAWLSVLSRVFSGGCERNRLGIPLAPPDPS